MIFLGIVNFLGIYMTNEFNSCVLFAGGYADAGTCPQIICQSFR